MRDMYLESSSALILGQSVLRSVFMHLIERKCLQSKNYNIPPFAATLRAVPLLF